MIKLCNYENDLEETENRLSTEGVVAEEAALQEAAAAADTVGIQDDAEPDSDSDNEDQVGILLWAQYTWAVC